MKLHRASLKVMLPTFGVATTALLLAGIGWYPGRLFWTEEMRRRSVAYHQRAESYAHLLTVIGNGWQEEFDRDRWAWGMAEKYWRAARIPWLPVGPDEPPPANVLRFGLDVTPRTQRCLWGKPSCEPRWTDRMRILMRIY